MSLDSLISQNFKEIHKLDDLWKFCISLSEYSLSQEYKTAVKFELQKAFIKEIDNGYDYTLYIKIYPNDYPIIKKFEIFVPSTSQPQQNTVWENVDLWKEKSKVITTSTSFYQPPIPLTQTSPQSGNPLPSCSCSLCLQLQARRDRGASLPGQDGADTTPIARG